MTRRLALLLVLACGCAGSPRLPVVPAPRPVNLGVEATEPSFSIPREALVEQSLWRFYTPVLTRLPAGRFALSGDSMVRIFDTDGVVLGRFDTGEAWIGAPHADAQANAMRTLAGSFDLERLAYAPFVDGPMLACDWDAEVCARVLNRGDVRELELVAPDTERSIARLPFVGPSFGIENAVETHGPSDEDAQRQAGPAEFNEFPDALVSGHTVAFVSSYGDGTRLCAVDFEYLDGGRCVAIDDGNELLELSAARNRVSIRSRPPTYAVTTFDLHTLRRVTLAPEEAHWYLEHGHIGAWWRGANWTISIDTTDAVLATVDAELVVTSEDGFVAWSGHRIRFFDRDARELGTSEVPFAPSMDSESFTTELDANELHVLSKDHGLWRVRAGEPATRLAEFPAYRGVRTSVLHGHIAVGSDELVLELGADGVVETDLSASVASRQQRERRRRAAFDEVRARLPQPTLVAFGNDAVASERYALVAGGRSVRVFDFEGRPIGREVPLPARVARSRCSELQFVADVSLVLSGPTPCIPTQIDFLEGTTRPFDGTRVRTAESTNGERVLVLSGGRARLLDGRTGTTLATVDLEPAGPEEVYVSADGRHGVVYGRSEAILLDFSGFASDAPTRTLDQDPTHIPMARFGQESFVAYDEVNEVLILLDSETDDLVVSSFRFTSDSSGPPPVSARVDTRTESGIGYGGSASVAGYLAFAGIDALTLLRLRDGATLDLEVVATSAGVALLSGHENVVDGMVVGGAPPMRVRTPAGVAALPSDGGRLARELRRFFGGPGEL